MLNLLAPICATWIAATAAEGLAPTPASMVVDLSGGQTARPLSLPRGRSATVELPQDAREVIVTDPTKVEAIIQTPRRVTLLGVSSGATEVLFFNAAGQRMLKLNTRVDQDTAAIAESINGSLHGSTVRVRAMYDSIILSGKVQTSADAQIARDIARAAVDKPEQVINAMQIGGKDQVMVKVRIVEVQRSIIKQLGVNLDAVMNQVGEPQFALSTAASWAVNGGLLGGATAGYSLDTTKQPVVSETIETPVQVYDSSTGSYHTEYVQKTVSSVDRNNPLATVTNTAGDPGLNKASAAIQAFERAGLIRTLAEPTLTSVSGEPAKFLAGGEFPVPIGKGQDGRVSIEFKPFGVGLGFTPVVLSEGRISLRISAEVSELSNTAALTLADTGTNSSLTVPSLTVRRAEATVELPSGGAMMIAGLIQESTRQSLDSLPGMMTLPVLGSLFRSRDFQSGESELVVIVTPYIASPAKPGDFQTPADGLKIADDASAVLMGRLNKVYRSKRKDDALTYQGPHGYIID